ncbi:MAG: hypothetical protein KDB53_00205 [Planctomycetes bacterium]|nr:hypothetical protein [Planctomycetota bacterium]
MIHDEDSADEVVPGEYTYENETTGNFGRFLWTGCYYKKSSDPHPRELWPSKD